MIFVSPHVVECLQPERLELYWPEIAEQLDTIPHVWDRWWTKESLFEMTLGGRFQCWAVGDAKMVRGIVFSQIAIYPANSILQVLLAFGEGLTETVDALDAAMEKFATAHGCAYIEVIGRFGWEPKLRSLDFRRSGVVLSRKLNQARTN